MSTSEIDGVLDKWNWAKGEEAAMKKKIEECKSKVEAYFMKQGITNFANAKYKVEKRMQQRESVSKKDLPADIWSQYAKTSEFSFFKLRGPDWQALCCRQ